MRRSLATPSLIRSSRAVAAGLLALSGLIALATPLAAQRVVAHRGASHDAPENTLAAFQLAWEQQSDGIEGDFYLTADRRIVCIHDADTERTTGVRQRVESSTLAELRQLDAGSWKGPAWAGEKIPTFEEVLATVPPDRLFVIELKSKAEIVPVLAAELRRLGALRRPLLIISFDESTVAACKAELPDVPVHWLTSLERKVQGERLPLTAAKVARTVNRCGADGVGMKGVREVIDAAFVAELRRRGCTEFHVWTIDDPDDARYFRDLGASGITTNRPDLIRRSLTAEMVPAQ